MQALDHSLGVDKPLVTRYLSWLGGLLHGNFGTSYAYQSAGRAVRPAALINSVKLAVLAFVIVVPLGIIGGVIAALYEGRAADRVISVTGLSLSSVPEFVSGIVLIVVFGVTLKVLPVTASAGTGAGVWNQFRHLILPAIPLVLVLFGYIARMARAGTIEALNSDYARTAVLKGLPQRDRDPPARAAQLAAADDHGHRDPDRVPDRRAGGGGGAVQLPGPREPDLQGRGRPRTSRCWRPGSSSSAWSTWWPR